GSSPPGSGEGSDNSDNDNNDNGGRDDQDDDDDDDDDSDFLESVSDIDDQDSAEDDDEGSEESDDLYPDDLDYEELLDELNELADDANKNDNDNGEDNEDKDNEDGDPPDDPSPPSADAEIPDDVPSNPATVSQLVMYLNWLIGLCSFFVSLTSFDAAGAVLNHAFSTLLDDLHRMTKSLCGSAVSMNVQDVLPGLVPVTNKGTIVSVLPRPALVLKALDLEELPCVTVKQDEPVPEQQLPFVISEEQDDTVDFERVKSVLLCLAGWIVVFKVLLGLHEAAQVVRLHAPVMDLNSVDPAAIPLTEDRDEGFDMALRIPLPDDDDDEFDMALRPAPMEAASELTKNDEELAATVEPAPVTIKVNLNALVFTSPLPPRTRTAVESAPAQSEFHPIAPVSTPPIVNASVTSITPITPGDNQNIPRASPPAGLFTPQQPAQSQGGYYVQRPPPPPAIVFVLPPPAPQLPAPHLCPRGSFDIQRQHYNFDAGPVTPCPPRHRRGEGMPRYAEQMGNGPFATPCMSHRRHREKRGERKTHVPTDAEKQARKERRQERTERLWKVHCEQKGFVHYPYREAKPEQPDAEENNNSELAGPSMSKTRTRAWTGSWVERYKPFEGESVCDADAKGSLTPSVSMIVAHDTPSLNDR
ncbi:hypothetical protein H0H87_002561, partial [Tephrocybe sp. NHM501043]